MQENIYKEDIVKAVRAELRQRQEERRANELKWKMNMSFLKGNQYAMYDYSGGIDNQQARYNWECRQVYNHIAPIIETRVANLIKTRAKFKIRTIKDYLEMSEASSGGVLNSNTSTNIQEQSTDKASDERSDGKTHGQIYESENISNEILTSLIEKHNLYKLMNTAAMWSESCGTVFYKVIWDSGAGRVLPCLTIDNNESLNVFEEQDEISKESITNILKEFQQNKHNVGAASDCGNNSIDYEGDIVLSVVSPFEIYPDCDAADLEDCESVIHAKAYKCSEILEKWGVEVPCEDITEKSEKKYSYATVIEKYEKPSKTLPEGRLTVVAGNALLYYGSMPYIIGENSTRAYPFVRQVSIETPGSFFGTSVVERLIPIQRAFNAVKNRKHEFMNRLALGILAVEDGTVDIDELETTGLAPGSIIVYRQGAKKPEFLENANVPKDFKEEEESLLYQFAVMSGVSDMMRTSTTPYSVTSGTALSLLLEQDDTRLSAPQEHCANALKTLLKKSLRLLRQYAKTPRKACSCNTEFYYTGNDIISDDVVFDINKANAN